MADNDNNGLMDKVKKLLALTSSSNEHEAAAAAAKVQELVQSYGLSLAEVEAHGQSTNTKRGAGTVDRRAMFDYQQDLMKTIAQNNFCLHDVRTIFVERKNRNSKQHFLVGRQFNIDVTLNMYDYLIETMKRLCEEHSYQAHAHRNLFYEGCTARLVERLNAQRIARELDEKRKKEEARARGETVNALVLTDVYGSEADLNNDHLNNYPPGTTAQRRAKKVNEEFARKERENEFIAKGIDKIVAFYMSHGYDQNLATEYAQAYHNQVQQERRRAGRRTSSHRGFARHDKAHSRIHTSAYKAGEQAGREIGLDEQILGNKTKLLK